MATPPFAGYADALAPPCDGRRATLGCAYVQSHGTCREDSMPQMRPPRPHAGASRLFVLAFALVLACGWTAIERVAAETTEAAPLGELTLIVGGLDSREPG